MGVMKIDNIKGIVEEERFEYKGYPCVVLFFDMGHRCGYVGMTVDNLANEEQVDEISCHGGITYGPSTTLHFQDDTNIWWIGFDTAHYGDGTDLMSTAKYFTNIDKLPYYSRPGEVRTLEYCKRECMKIVDQLIEFKEAKQ